MTPASLLPCHPPLGRGGVVRAEDGVCHHLPWSFHDPGVQNSLPSPLHAACEESLLANSIFCVKQGGAALYRLPSIQLPAWLLENKNASLDTLLCSEWGSWERARLPCDATSARGGVQKWYFCRLAISPGSVIHRTMNKKAVDPLDL